MSFALLIVGIVFLVASIKNTQSSLFTLIQGDFTGSQNFIFWLVAILLIGALGYVKKLQPISTAFLFLVVLVLILTRGNPSAVGGGFFTRFTSAIQATQQASPTAATGTTATGANSILNIFGTNMQAAGTGIFSTLQGITL